MSSTSFTDLKPYIKVQDAKLSEGITYFNNELFWVDIFESKIFKLTDINDISTLQTFDINHTTYSKNAKYPYDAIKYAESTSVIFPVDENTILFGSRFGIGKLDCASKEWEYIATYDQCTELSPERCSRLRSNDGNVSPCGKYIYIGLMDTFEVPLTEEGCILKYDLSAKEFTMVYESITIPNSIHFKANTEGVIYFTDSLGFAIWEYDEKTGKKRKAIDIMAPAHNNTQFESPEPDGCVVDYENNLLITSLWSTSKIQSYDLGTGKLVNEYILPVPRISCCCAYGPDLFVTTANLNIDNDRHDKSDLDLVGGSIYKLPNVIPNGKLKNSKATPLY